MENVNLNTQYLHCLIYFIVLLQAFIQVFSIIKIYLKIRHLDDNNTDKKIKENYISSE